MQLAIQKFPTHNWHFIALSSKARIVQFQLNPLEKLNFNPKHPNNYLLTDAEIFFHHLWIVITFIEENCAGLNQAIIIRFLGISKSGKDLLSCISY